VASLFETPGRPDKGFDEGKGLSTEAQQYDPTSIINELRYAVDQWRQLKNPNDWQGAGPRQCLRHKVQISCAEFIPDVESTSAFLDDRRVLDGY
jgi:hypothetical protein